MSDKCDKCSKHECLFTTELTKQDIDNFLDKLSNGDFDIKKKTML